MKRGQFKLSDAKVRAIFLDRRQAAIVAADFECSQSMIYSIWKGQRYPELTKNLGSPLEAQVVHELKAQARMETPEALRLARIIIGQVLEDIRQRI